MENQTRSNLTLASIFSRFLVGFASGFIGSIVLGIVLFLSWSVVGNTLSPTDVASPELGMNTGQQTHPLFLSIITLAVFLSTLVGNMAYVFLITVVDEKYIRRSTALTHIFFGNLVTLLFMLPVYALASRTFGSSGVAMSAILHLVITSFLTLLILEVLHQSKYILVNAYGIFLGVILFFVVGSLLIGSSSSTLVLLLSLPLVLGMLAFGNRTAEVFYAWIYKSYGSDFLNIDTKFGQDYGQKETEGRDFDL